MATGDAFSYLSCDKCIRRKFWSRQKKKAFPTKEKKKDRAQIQPVSLSFSFNS